MEVTWAAFDIGVTGEQPLTPKQKEMLGAGRKLYTSLVQLQLKPAIYSEQAPDEELERPDQFRSTHGLVRGKQVGEYQLRIQV